MAEPIGEDTSQAPSLEEEDAKQGLDHSLLSEDEDADPEGEQSAESTLPQSDDEPGQDDEKEKQKKKPEEAELNEKVAALHRSRRRPDQRSTDRDIILSKAQQASLYQLVRMRRRSEAPSKVLQAENTVLKAKLAERTLVLGKLWRSAEKGHQASKDLGKTRHERDQAISLSKSAMNYREKADKEKKRWQQAALVLTLLVIAMLCAIFTSPDPVEPVSTAPVQAPKVAIRYEGYTTVVSTNFEGAEKLTTDDVFTLWYETSHRSEDMFAIFGQPQGMILPDGTPRVFIFATCKIPGERPTEIRFVHRFKQNE